MTILDNTELLAVYGGACTTTAPYNCICTKYQATQAYSCTTGPECAQSCFTKYCLSSGNSVSWTWFTSAYAVSGELQS